VVQNEGEGRTGKYRNGQRPQIFFLSRRLWKRSHNLSGIGYYNFVKVAKHPAAEYEL